MTTQKSLLTQVLEAQNSAKCFLTKRRGIGEGTAYKETVTEQGNNLIFRAFVDNQPVTECTISPLGQQYLIWEGFSEISRKSESLEIFNKKIGDFQKFADNNSLSDFDVVVSDNPNDWVKTQLTTLDDRAIAKAVKLLPESVQQEYNSRVAEYAAIAEQIKMLTEVFDQFFDDLRVTQTSVTGILADFADTSALVHKMEELGYTRAQSAPEKQLIKAAIPELGIEAEYKTIHRIRLVPKVEVKPA